MTARWLPDDDELDALARGREAFVPSPERAEQNRTALLATAAGRRQKARRSIVPYAIAGAAIAAAAAVALWLGVRPADEVVASLPKQVITPISAARFERVTDGADSVVRLDDGKLAVQVATLVPGERFRIKTADAEVEVRGARFEIAADQGRLASVAVRAGRAEIRVVGQQVVVLAAGESWVPTRTAQRDEIEPHRPAVDHAAGDRVAAADTPSGVATPNGVDRPRVVDKPGGVDKPGVVDNRRVVDKPGVVDRPRVDKPGVVDNRRVVDKPGVVDNRRVVTKPGVADKSTIDGDPRRADTPSVVDKPVEPKPGEAEFRAAMASLRGADPRGAATSFSRACAIASNPALAEDACFWAGAAARRAGDTRAARPALAAFLQRFPSSARAGEAASLLGWIVYEAGELDAAEALFRKAAGDRVPQIRDSAQRGLTAIDRKRRTP